MKPNELNRNGSIGIVRFTLGGLLLLVAINAFAGGYYAVSGAKDVPVEWLKGSGFHNYFIPGILLFIVVGGSCLAASILVFRRNHLAIAATYISATIIFIWLAAQISIIGYVSWMQPATAFAMILIFLFTSILARNKKAQENNSMK